MSNFLVSIIIPTFNRGAIIGETLNSVLNQTYTNWECIVVDDGSTDATDNVLAEYCKKDARFQYHKRPSNLPKGGNVCRNIGFTLSKGDFIKWLDSDDLLSKDLLSAQVNTASLYLKNEYIVITSKWNYFKETVVYIKPKIKEINRNYDSGFDLINDFGKYNTFLPPHVYLVKRDIILKSGLWNETLSINQDGEFFTRVLLNTSKVVHAMEGMVYYRFGLLEDNVSSFSNPEKVRDSILSWILIDAYLKVYIKKNTTIQYVENAKKVLLKNIDDKEILAQFDYFLKRKSFKLTFINNIKDYFKNS